MCLEHDQLRQRMRYRLMKGMTPIQCRQAEAEFQVQKRRNDEVRELVTPRHHPLDDITDEELAEMNNMPRRNQM